MCLNYNFKFCNTCLVQDVIEVLMVFSFFIAGEDGKNAPVHPGTDDVSGRLVDC